MSREITNADLWSAVRGLRMFSLEPAELRQLFEAHKDSSLFASRVIAEAAWQVFCTKHRRSHV